MSIQTCLLYEVFTLDFKGPMIGYLKYNLKKHFRNEIVGDRSGTTFFSDLSLLF